MSQGARITGRRPAFAQSGQPDAGSGFYSPLFKPQFAACLNHRKQSSVHGRLMPSRKLQTISAPPPFSSSSKSPPSFAPATCGRVVSLCVAYFFRHSPDFRWPNRSRRVKPSQAIEKTKQPIHIQKLSMISPSNESSLVKPSLASNQALTTASFLGISCLRLLWVLGHWVFGYLCLLTRHLTGLVRDIPRKIFQSGFHRHADSVLDGGRQVARLSGSLDGKKPVY